MGKRIRGLLLTFSLTAFASLTPCLTPEAASAVAEAETLGEAVTARPVSLSKGGFGGW